MNILVDADVLSEPTKEQPHPRVLTWLQQHSADLVVNAIILGELEYGILKLPAGRRRLRLQDWFQQGATFLTVIDMDAGTSRAWANLLAELKCKGRSMPVNDSLIAATARQHDLTLATRNTRDYRHAGVRLFNP
jgi:predicted nucleic acid-binding protein